MTPALFILKRLLSISLAAAALLPFTSRSLAQAPAPPPVAPAPTGPIPKPMPLYPHGAPGALGNGPADTPMLYPFVPPAQGPMAAVLILPGGGYQNIALGHEGFQYAEWLNAQGVAAYVLDYRVAPYHYPAEVEDGVAAMRYIRTHATDNHIDPDRIGVWGSSAGGSLAAILETECHVSDQTGSGLSGVNCEPNFAILAYPVISMEEPMTHVGSRNNLLGPNPAPELAKLLSAQLHVTADTPPTFLFATTGDPVVPVGNSVAMYNALVTQHVPAEIHLYDFSNHGCGLCGDIPQLASWPGLLRTWLMGKNVIKQDAPPMPPPAHNMPDWPSGLDGPGHS